MAHNIGWKGFPSETKGPTGSFHTKELIGRLSKKPDHATARPVPCSGVYESSSWKQPLIKPLRPKRISPIEPTTNTLCIIRCNLHFYECVRYFATHMHAFPGPRQLIFIVRRG